jgi:hypothetical protein
LLQKTNSKAHSIGLLLKLESFLISGRAIKIYTLQKKILITATDIFALSKQFEKTALKVFRISPRKQLVQSFCDLMKVESQK